MTVRLCVARRPPTCGVHPQSAGEAHRYYSTGGGKSNENARICLDTSGRNKRNGESGFENQNLSPKNASLFFVCAAPVLSRRCSVQSVGTVYSRSPRAESRAETASLLLRLLRPALLTPPLKEHASTQLLQFANITG